MVTSNKEEEHPSSGHTNENGKIFMKIILLTSSNNQISEFRIPNMYNEIFVLIFLMILTTHFEGSLRFRKN